MNAKDFLKAHTEEHVEAVAKDAGTTFAYFKQLAYGHRHPSRKLAERLEDASEKKMTAFELLFPETEESVA